MKHKFGWDLPPGVTNQMIEEQAGAFEEEEMTENWHGKVTVTANLVLDYEFDDDFHVAKSISEAMEIGLELFCEDVIELVYQDPDDLARWIRDVAQVIAERKKK